MPSPWSCRPLQAASAFDCCLLLLVYLLFLMSLMQLLISMLLDQFTLLLVYCVSSIAGRLLAHLFLIAYFSSWLPAFAGSLH
jgi:hypothetical protein